MQNYSEFQMSNSYDNSITSERSQTFNNFIIIFRDKRKSVLRSEEDDLTDFVESLGCSIKAPDAIENVNIDLNAIDELDIDFRVMKFLKMIILSFSYSI